MDAPLVIAIAVTVAAACAAIFLAIKSKTQSEATQKAESELAEARAEITVLQAGATEDARRTAESDTRLSEIRQQFDQATTELHKLRESEKELLTEVQVQKKEIKLQNTKLKDWEEAQKQFMDGANAALAESAAKLSNKLLEDHKRENTAAKEDSEKRVKKATEELFKQFETISNSVVSLNDLSLIHISEPTRPY